MIISDLSYIEEITQENFILGGSKKSSQPYTSDITHIAIGEAGAKAIVSSPYLSTFTHSSVSTRAGRLPGGSLGSLSRATSISIVGG